MKWIIIFYSSVYNYNHLDAAGAATANASCTWWDDNVPPATLSASLPAASNRYNAIGSAVVKSFATQHKNLLDKTEALMAMLPPSLSLPTPVRITIGYPLVFPARDETSTLPLPLANGAPLLSFNTPAPATLDDDPTSTLMLPELPPLPTALSPWTTHCESENRETE